VPLRQREVKGAASAVPTVSIRDDRNDGYEDQRGGWIRHLVEHKSSTHWGAS